MQVSAGSGFFSWICCRTLSKSRFSQPLSTLPQTFYPVAQTKKSELGFVMLIEFPGEAVETISGYARS